MRILFLAPKYQDLYKPILEELKKRHEVYYLEDKELPTDCYLVAGNPLKKTVFSIYNKVAKAYERYWNSLFEETPALNEPFDVFFCIQGLSVCRALTHRLRAINPNIRCSLYIWDTLRYYDYGRNVPLFDKCYSFDYQDAENNKNINFLPFYWVGYEGQSQEIMYDLSIIGNDHDGRFEIVNQLLPEIERLGLKHFIKIKPCDEYNIIPPIGRLIRTLFRRAEKKKMQQNYRKCLASPLCLKQNMSVAEVEEVIRQSKCIIDTDRESQTGTTPRVIWALAQGKGVLTTNKNIVKMPFYSESVFSIFDRENPTLDVQFIKNYEPKPVSDYIAGLRIDKWVVRFIQCGTSVHV